MRNTIGPVALGRGAVAAMMILAGAVAPAWAQDQRVISVTGEASVEAAPDMATIRLGVTNEAPEAGTAMEATSVAVRAVIDRLSAQGIADRDIQTSGFSLQPVWSGRGPNNSETPEITGFFARNGVTVRVRDLTALGGILDAVVQDGANTFNGLEFGLQAPEPLESEARQAAVKDAMARAEELAEAAGVTLGSVQSMSEQSYRAKPMMMEMASARSMGDVPVAAGEVGVQAQVSMSFAIGE